MRKLAGPLIAVGALALAVNAQTIDPSASHIDAMHTSWPICDSAASDGLDITTPIGTPVKAATNGVVMAVTEDAPNGCGLTITIKDDDGSIEGFGWLSAVNYKPGQRVSRGATIALTGQSGNAAAPKLHWTLFTAAGVKVDPRSVGSTPKNPDDFTEPEQLEKAIAAVNASDATQRVKDGAIRQLRTDYNLAREMKAQKYTENLHHALDAWYANNKNWRKIPKDLWSKLSERDRGRLKNGIDPELVNPLHSAHQS